MAYIRNVSELPKWFNLDNYRFNLPANDLLQLFIIRFAVLDLLLDDVDISCDEVLEDQDVLLVVNNFNKIPLAFVNQRTVLKKSILSLKERDYLYNDCLDYAFSKIINDPLILNNWLDINSQPFLTLNYLLKNHVNRCIRKYEVNPIQELTIDDVGYMSVHIPSAVREYLLHKYSEYDSAYDGCVSKKVRDSYLEELDNYFLKLDSDDCEGYEKFCELDYYDFAIEDEHPYSANPCISINLNMPDAVLREQFSAWLSNTRKKASKVIIEDDLDSDFLIDSNGVKIAEKINKYKIIPFIDLMLWELKTGNKIKLSVYAHALFNDGSADGEFIRKTIKPFVQNLINDDYKIMSELFALKNMEDFSL